MTSLCDSGDGSLYMGQHMRILSSANITNDSTCQCDYHVQYCFAQETLKNHTCRNESIYQCCGDGNVVYNISKKNNSFSYYCPSNSSAPLCHDLYSGRYQTNITTFFDIWYDTSYGFRDYCRCKESINYCRLPTTTTTAAPTPKPVHTSKPTASPTRRPTHAPVNQTITTTSTTTSGSTSSSFSILGLSSTTSIYIIVGIVGFILLMIILSLLRLFLRKRHDDKKRKMLNVITPKDKKRMKREAAAAAATNIQSNVVPATSPNDVHEQDGNNEYTDNQTTAQKGIELQNTNAENNADANNENNENNVNNYETIQEEQVTTHAKQNIIEY